MASSLFAAGGFRRAYDLGMNRRQFSAGERLMRLSRGIEISLFLASSKAVSLIGRFKHIRSMQWNPAKI